MSSIYIRKRIKIPKIKMIFTKNRKKFNVIVIFIIAITTFIIITKSINPIFETLCREKAKAIATNIVNISTSEVLKNTDYKKMITIIKDNEKNTNVLQTDVITMNLLASEISEKIQNRLTNLDNQKVSIPMGSISGIKYISGIGPKVNIKLHSVGNLVTEFKTSFVSSGVNQTLHRVYLEVQCEVRILTPYSIINEKTINQVLLLETVIVGDIPNTYYNLEGLKETEALEIVD